MKRNHMGKISVSEGRVCIIKTDELTTVREGLDQIKTAIIDCTAGDKNNSSNIDTFLFIDLSLFNIINSSVIGVLGSVLMNPRIRLIGLCGVQPPVRDILTRFGVLSPEKVDGFVSHEVLKNNMSKVVTFETVEQGLGRLDPK
ncbi:MAG: anti-anti-sigma regulatory factor [Desulforhopalus sp.]